MSDMTQKSGTTSGITANGGQGGQQQSPPPPPQGLDVFSTIWNKTTPPAPPPPAPNSPPAPNNASPPAPNKPDGGLGEYLSKQQYFVNVDKTKFAEAIRNGDAEAVMGFMTDAFRAVHEKALLASENIAKHYSENAAKEMGTKTSSDIYMNQLYTRLFEKHGDLAHPAIKPMAQATFKQMLAKGDDPDTAIKKTYEFYLAVGKHVVKPPPNGGGRGQNGGDNSSDSPTLDFDQILGAAQQQ